MTFYGCLSRCSPSSSSMGESATGLRQFARDDDSIEDLKDELIQARRLVVGEQRAVLVWSGRMAEPGAWGFGARCPIGP